LKAGLREASEHGNYDVNLTLDFLREAHYPLGDYEVRNDPSFEFVDKTKDKKRKEIEEIKKYLKGHRLDHTIKTFDIATKKRIFDYAAGHKTSYAYYKFYYISDIASAEYILSCINRNLSDYGVQYYAYYQLENPYYILLHKGLKKSFSLEEDSFPHYVFYINAKW